MKDLYAFHIGLFHCDVRRLAFLGRFLAEHTSAESLVELGEIIGKTRAAVRYMFFNDDMNLNDIYAIVEHYGYDLEFAYQDPAPAAQPEGESENEVDVIIMLPENDKKRLGFLKKAISDRRISLRKLSELTGFATQTIKKRFEMDDCPVSYIYDIARQIGSKVVIKITKKV